MSYIRRLAWLAAWGVWAWLGVGLYRELPRDLGAPIATLPARTLGKDVSPVGFIGDTNRFVRIRHGSSLTSTLEIFDAETGGLVQSIEGPGYSDYLWPDCFQPKRGILLGTQLWTENVEDGSGLHVLDLAKAKWRRISNRKFRCGSVHAHKPWVVAVDDAREKRVSRVVVVDWETGQETIVRAVLAQESINGRVFFLSDDDRVVIPLKSRLWELPGLKSGPEKESVEIWKIDNGKAVLQKTLTDLPVGMFPSYSQGGRVTFAEPHGTTSIDVYDVDQERYLISDPPRDQRPPPPARGTFGWEQPPVLSANGHRVFGGNPMTLRDVDTGKIMWRSEDMAFVERSHDLIFTFESWERYWKNWLPKLKYRTYALRDMETGRVALRFATNADGAPVIQPHFWNAAGTFAVANTGEVYRLPLPVNWPLWALCQTILASPIVILWALLLWRRRRRARLVVETAT